MAPLDFARGERGSATRIATWLVALAAIALCSAARAEQPLPVYPGAVHTRIGGDLIIAGEAYRIAYFVTPDAPRKVGVYFAQKLRAAGYPVTVDGDFTEQGVVSAFYTREGLIRSVVVRAYGDKTVGFCVLKDAWSHAPPPPAPVVEGALVSQELLARGDGAGGRSRALLVERPLPEVRDALARALVQDGYALARESGQRESTRVLEHAKGPERVLTTLVQIAPGLTGVHQAFAPAGGKR